MATIQESVKKLVSAGLASPSQVVGCSDTEIRQLESLVNAKLPIIYKEFLKTMGQCAGSFLAGTDLFMPKLFNLRTWAETLLQRTDSPFRLPPSIFVFLVHQGYQFMFFHLNQGDDPEVFHFEEGEEQPRAVFSHFTDWLAASVDDEIAAYRDISRI